MVSVLVVAAAAVAVAARGLQEKEEESVTVVVVAVSAAVVVVVELVVEEEEEEESSRSSSSSLPAARNLNCLEFEDPNSLKGKTYKPETKNPTPRPLTTTETPNGVPPDWHLGKGPKAIRSHDCSSTHRSGSFIYTSIFWAGSAGSWVY